jgi:hypothetical protein
MWVRFPPGTPVLNGCKPLLRHAHRHFDDLTLRALERDWAAWLGEPSDDLMNRSQFNLFHDIGIHLFGRNSRRALDYAIYFFEKRQNTSQVFEVSDPQRYFALR